MPTVHLPGAGIKVQIQSQPRRDAHQNGANLFMIHSTWTDSAMFDRQFSDAALAGELNLYAINLVGFEGSSRADREKEIDLDWHAEYIAETIAALGIAPCHILGHGMGAAIAQRVALRSPGLVASLVLIALWAPEESAAVIAQSEAFSDLLAADTVGDFRREQTIRSVLAGVGPNLTPEETKWWLDTVKRVWFDRDEDEWVAWTRIRFDVQSRRNAIPREDLQRMSVRTLVVHSENDPTSKLSVAEANTAALPAEKSWLLVIPGAYLYGQYSHYETLDKSILAFVRGDPVEGARTVSLSADKLAQDLAAASIADNANFWGVEEEAKADSGLRRQMRLRVRDFRTHPVIVEVTTVTEVHCEPAGSSPRLAYLSDRDELSDWGDD